MNKFNDPKYGIGETVYSRRSALNGYVEPLIISKISFDKYYNTWSYSWKSSTSDKNDSKVQVVEAELLDL